jgi:hypothetical protein
MIATAVREKPLPVLRRRMACCRISSIVRLGAPIPVVGREVATARPAATGTDSDGPMDHPNKPLTHDG